MICKFSIPGEPKGKGRPRMTKTGHTYTPNDTVLYEQQVRAEYCRQCNFMFPKDCMLDVRVFAYYGIPKSASQKKRRMMLAKVIRPTKKPDWDNVGKIVCDSLNGIAYHDDAQIVDSMVRKFYSESPRVDVVVRDYNPIKEQEGRYERS